MSRKARAAMLVPGDIVAMFVADRIVSNATIEEIRNDEFTPRELTPYPYITFWTTDGRYDVPADAELTVMAWAPMPESE